MFYRAAFRLTSTDINFYTDSTTDFKLVNSWLSKLFDYDFDSWVQYSVDGRTWSLHNDIIDD